MKLDLQQIRAITQDAETVREEQGVIWFSRFTEEEMALYLPRPGLDFRAACTAGIQLEFTTDAEALFLQVTTPKEPWYHRIFAYDIWVEDKLVGQLRNFGENPENGFYDESVFPTAHPGGSFPLCPGEKTVRIVFPWSMNLGLERLELSGASFVRPRRRKKTLLLFGDSITQGSCSLYPSLTYPARLAQWLQAEMINKGVGCEAYYPPLAKACTAPEPDCILVSYGANDWFRYSEEEFRENCREFWKTLCEKYPNSLKFALTPLWYMGQTGDQVFGSFDKLREGIFQVCKEFPQIRVIDCTDFVSRDSRDFGDLVVHPNHEGFGKFFENLKAAMAPHLSSL